MSIFHPESPVMTALSRFFDMVILNILCFIGCLPVITTGASFTALYTVTMQIARNDDTYLVKAFLKAFKDNLKSSTITFFIMTAAGIVLYVDIGAILLLPEGIQDFVKIVLYLVTGIYIMTLCYIFPYIARFSDTVFKSIKNSFLIGIYNLHYSLPIVLLPVVCITATLWNVEMFVYGCALWCVIGTVVLAMIQSLFLSRVFAKYEKTEE